MPSSEIKLRIENSVKDAMRARDKPRLGALRLIMSELKNVEINERIELEDDSVLVILDKMSKQRRDSLTQYEQAGRDDLVQQESFELDLIKEFMPEALHEAEIVAIIDEAIAATGAATMKDMGQLMAVIRPQVQGRANMGEVSAIVKRRLQ